jgi:hypothetical protein
MRCSPLYLFAISVISSNFLDKVGPLVVKIYRFLFFGKMKKQLKKLFRRIPLEGENALWNLFEPEEHADFR